MRSKLAEMFIEKARKDGYLQKTHIGNNCKIDPTAIIGENCCIGDNTIIRENVVIGNDVTIEENCIIGEAPTIWDADSADCDIFNKKLIIKDNVSIKSHTVIERGGLTSRSEIGEGTIIGPFCYIGHDARIGSKCVVFPYVFFCGNVTLKDNVVVLSHSTLFNFVVLDACTTVFHGTNVFQDSEKKAFIIGQHGDTLKEYCKKRNFLKRASKTLQRIKDLEDAINGKDRREHQEEI